MTSPTNRPTPPTNRPEPPPNRTPPSGFIIVAFCVLLAALFLRLLPWQIACGGMFLLAIAYGTNK
jgi:hypothetical protein